MPRLLDLDKARKELDSKDLQTIERETAVTWGGRAGAGYANVLAEQDQAEGMRWFWEAETYRAEAIEHAAMTEDARFLERLTAEIESHRAKAREHLVEAGHAFVQGGRTPKQPQSPKEQPKEPKQPKDIRGQRPGLATPGLGRRSEPRSPAQ